MALWLLNVPLSLLAVANFVFLLLARWTGTVSLSEFFVCLFRSKQVRVNQSSHVVDHKTKTINLKMLKHYVKELQSWVIHFCGKRNLIALPNEL